MPAIWMDVDAALSEVPINSVALIDDSDFKTREESVVYNQSGLDLLWNFVTTAGAYTQTAVTPTDTGGDYDWVNQGNGMYSIEIPASGGASINNDTEGFGWFSGFATGILPWSGPIIGFRAAGLNNLLIDSAHSATRGLGGTALPDAAADAAGGLPISDVGGLDLDTKLANTNEVTAARMGALTDWIDGGRLDLLLDAIPTTAMRGTDNAATAAKLLAYVQLLTRSDAAIETDNATELTAINADGGSGAGNFSSQTDAEEALRDRGDAAWAGAPEACSGTFTVETADTVFNLTATSGTLSSNDDAYNNGVICFYDDSGSVYEVRKITDYDGTNTRVTVDTDLTFPGEDGVDTWAIYRNAYCPTTAGDSAATIRDTILGSASASYIAQGTVGQRIHHAGKGRY